MGQLKQKLVTIHDALTTLKDGIALFYECEKTMKDNATKKNERFFLSARDSMIQRFEYCTDLLWKTLKLYLEEIEKVTLTTFSPRGIIRETVKINAISEQEGEQIITMVENRNETSHIYREEIAQKIAEKVPQFYELMHSVVQRIEKKINTL